MYKGIIHPIERTTKGLFQSGTDLAQIKSNLLAIIMTRPGERVMRPFFGVPLHKLYGKSEEMIIEEGRQMIALSIKRYETRIQVTDIQILMLSENTLNIAIFFIDPRISDDLQEVQELTLQTTLD